jgi:ATP-dependent helicase/nuclease subunit A
MRFNIFLPASEFTTQESLIGSCSDEKILVQGVIDLCFVSSDDQVILCDYKTDRLSREMLKNKELAKRYLAKKHIQQLSYYCKAIESILGRKPDKVYIYSLAFGDTFDIDL